MEQKDNLFVTLSFEFSLKIILFTEQLEEQKKWVIARQLLKSDTSIGANVWEAQNCEKQSRLHPQTENSRKRSIRNSILVDALQKGGILSFQ